MFARCWLVDALGEEAVARHARPLVDGAFLGWGVTILIGQGARKSGTRLVDGRRNVNGRRAFDGMPAEWAASGARSRGRR